MPRNWMMTGASPRPTKRTPPYMADVQARPLKIDQRNSCPRGRKPIPSWPKVEQVMRLDPGDRVNAFFKVNGGRPLGRRVLGEGGENGDLEWEDLMGIYVICICK